MKRWTLAVLAVASLLAADAIASTTPDAKASQAPQIEHRTETQRTASSAERWRGRPALRGAADAATATEYLPSVNFTLAGQAGGAFVIPSF